MDCKKISDKNYNFRGSILKSGSFQTERQEG